MSEKLPLSLVLITCNAAARLRDVLASVPFADEIILVDSGSTDDTAAIATTFGAQVVHQGWMGFGPQKSHAVSLARHDWVLRGFRQFDAPVSIVVTYDRSIHGGDIAPFDCGAVTNALVNAAWSRGLGCVINSQGIMQSPVVREYAGIGDDQVIMICVAMGYPDEGFPANSVVSHRKSVDEATVFVGFED